MAGIKTKQTPKKKSLYTAFLIFKTSFKNKGFLPFTQIVNFNKKVNPPLNFVHKPIERLNNVKSRAYFQLILYFIHSRDI